MNNAKMWLVVKPTVGIPLFLSAVAVGSFAVHLTVLSNTSWVADFLSGKPLGTGMSAATVVPGEATAAKATPAQTGTQEMQISLQDGTTATAIIREPEIVASLE